MIFLGGYFYQFEHISLKASENGKQLTSGRGATVTEAVYQYENMVFWHKLAYLLEKNLKISKR